MRLEVAAGGGDCEGGDKPAPEPAAPEEDEVDDEDGPLSEPDSDTGTQPEEEEDKNLSVEELSRKLDKVLKAHEFSVSGLSTTCQQLRATSIGQDRYWRRYWALPAVGAVFVEGMESAAPDDYLEQPQGDLEDAEAMSEGPAVKEEATAAIAGENEPGIVKAEADTDKVDSEHDKVEGENVKIESENDITDAESSKTDAENSKTDCENGENEVKTSKAEVKIDETELKNCETKIENGESDTKQVEGAVKEENEVQNGENETDDVEMDVKRDEAAMKNGDDEALDMKPHEIAVKAEREEPMEQDGEPTAVKPEADGNLMAKAEDVDESEHRKVRKRESLEEAMDVDGANVKREPDEDSTVKEEEGTELANGELSDTPKKSKPLCDSLSRAKVELQSELFGARLAADRAGFTFGRLGACMEKEADAQSPAPAPAPSPHFPGTANANGAANGVERNWFSVLPRDACDAASVISGNSSARLLGGCGGGGELRIPVFPPPSRMSPSPGGSQCDSPGPLALTPDEAEQLEALKKAGASCVEPAPVRPVPHDLRRGWWRITDVDQLRSILSALHLRGFREAQLRRVLARYLDHALEASAGTACIVHGDADATELAITDDDHKVSEIPGGAPFPDPEERWDPAVALRVDLSILDQVETLEDKVANASMQVKGWKVPARASTDASLEFRPACLPDPDTRRKDPVNIAKQRLAALESAIERRYLKPPLGMSSGDVNLQAMAGPDSDDSLPKGLVTWREAVARAHTAAQLAMALYMLEASVAWDKSIMKANCQFCHSGENEDKLLLCDGCDKGYHMYCFRPKMEVVPDGDWYCFECMNKATGERNCIVCGKKAVGKNLALCDACPRAFHLECATPVLAKPPRGKWHCPACAAKMPRKRAAPRKSKTSEGTAAAAAAAGTELAQAQSPAVTSLPPTPGASTPLGTAEEALPSPPPAPAPVAAPTPPSPRKERQVTNKKLVKELKPCLALMAELEGHDDAWPFLLPVNTKQFPTYRKIIKAPMDLSTIKKKLTDTTYKARDEFCVDVRQIFNNCETFNEDDSPVGKAGHLMRDFFEARWTEMAGHPKAAAP